MKKLISTLFYVDEINENNTKIYTLYALRFILFIFIFVEHCYYNVGIEALRQPELAVSGFIILSGFLNGYIYKNKYDKISIKEMIKFTKKRMKKFYPLHLVMLLICIPFSGIFSYTCASDFLDFFKRLFCNVTLIQSYINDRKYYFSFNGVTWFLSAYLFLAVITIPLLCLINKLNKEKYGKAKLVCVSLILFLVTFFLSCIVKINQLNEEFWISVFPPSRIFEYFIGMIYGNIIKDTKITFKFDKVVFSILELISIFVLIVFIKDINKIPNMALFISKKMNQWIIPMILMIIIFSYQKGLISKLMSSKLLVYLGQISMYMFMIHQPLITYVLSATGKTIYYRYLGLYMLILTVILGSIIEKLLHKNAINEKLLTIDSGQK